MITLRVNRDRDKKISSFTLSGHADSGPYGYDLVCAGVSAVSFGAVNAVEELAGVQLKVSQRENGGFLECVCPTMYQTSGQAEKIQLILEAMLVSLRTIQMSYGNYIKIIDKGGYDHA